MKILSLGNIRNRVHQTPLSLSFVPTFFLVVRFVLKNTSVKFGADWTNLNCPTWDLYILRTRNAVFLGGGGIKIFIMKKIMLYFNCKFSQCVNMLFNNIHAKY
jgi:hypothetical protein